MNNICFSHSLSLICAITTNGDWFATNLNNTNNSEKFIDFIDNLSKWIKEDLQYEMSQITLLMDNSTIHKAKRCLDYMNKLGWKVVLLFPYSPEFAPIELCFNTLKKRIVKQVRNESIKRYSNVGFRNIKEWFATLSKDEIISYWTMAIKSMNSQLCSHFAKEG